MNSWPLIKRFLRKPIVILGEITAVALAGALGAVLPERHIFQSVWFAAVTLLAAASLAVVVGEQFRRVRSQWRQPSSSAQFASAPFKTEFERPATTPGPQQKIWSKCRLGLAGSLVFHCGLLLLILAGAWRALFVSEAVVDLLEGETLAPNAAWSAQWPGVLGQALQLDQPITLESVSGSRYADGSLRDLRAKLSVGEVAVNHQLQLGGGRLYLAQQFGPAALLERNSSQRTAVLLNGDGRGNFSSQVSGAGGLQIFLRAGSERPTNLDVRVMRGSGLLAAGSLGVGDSLTLPDGETLALRGTPMWARLHGSRDSALWLAYVGMIFTMAGAAMMFCLIKLDFCVVVTPLGDRERIFIALKPQRFAPLFQERFDKLVRELADSEDKRPEMEAGERTANPPSILHPPRALPASLARTVLLFLVCAGVAMTSGCDRVSQTQAKQLVERYNQVVSEAYRRGDVRLIDPVVGLNEGKKLTGLIGVRLDLGITLDSKLLSLEVTGVMQAKNELHISTNEKWNYRDLKIGTGEQVGQASEDNYEMIYFFTNVNKTWLVDEIKFAAPPQVGRTNVPWIADRGQLHGVNSPEARP